MTSNFQQPADRLLCQKEKEVKIIQEQILNKQFQGSLNSFTQFRGSFRQMIIHSGLEMRL